MDLSTKQLEIVDKIAKRKFHKYTSSGDYSLKYVEERDRLTEIFQTINILRSSEIYPPHPEDADYLVSRLEYLIANER